MKAFNLEAKAINSVTKMKAEKEGVNIWRQVQEHVSVILVSPEMLSTQGFENMLQQKVFKERVFGLIVDEIHLLNTWGAGFRPMFLQIGYIRARFPTNTILMGLTATLRKGKHTDSVLKFLGLNPEKIHLIQRSNARRDVQILIRTIRANANTEHFPQLDWVLRAKGNVLIFCTSIRVGFRLAVYLWHLDPKDAVLRSTIRLFNSLNSPAYNTKTLQLLQANTGAKITIATDKLSVGIDVPNFETVVIIDPKDLDDLWQKGGRVGRDRTQVKSPRVIVYIPVNKMNASQEFAHSQSLQPFATRSKKKRKLPLTTDNNPGVSDFDPGLARVVTSSCPPSAIDDEYNNPSSDPKCSPECTTCAQIPPSSSREKSCNCSGCVPEEGAELIGGSTTNPAVKKKTLPLNIRVTKDMRPVGLTILKRFRQGLWLKADETETGMLPPEAYFPDSVMEQILDGLPYLLSKTTILAIQTSDSDSDESFHPEACRTLLRPFITDNKFLIASAPLLLKTILEIHENFDEIRQRKKETEKAKRDARKLEKKTLSGENVEVSVTDAISDIDERSWGELEGGVHSEDSS